MRALVKSRPEPGLWLEDVSEPEYGINDVLIRVHRTGICGTDVHIHRWDEWGSGRSRYRSSSATSSSARSSPSETTSATSIPATWSAARGTSSAAAAGTAWPDVGTCAPTRR